MFPRKRVLFARYAPREAAEDRRNARRANPVAIEENQEESMTLPGKVKV